MSYEPHVLIWADDLLKHKSKIERKTWGLEKNGHTDSLSYRACKEVLTLMESPPVNFPHRGKRKAFGIYSMHPEGTLYNSVVRSLLNSFNIEYQIDY